MKSLNELNSLNEAKDELSVLKDLKKKLSSVIIDAINAAGKADKEGDSNFAEKIQNALAPVDSSITQLEKIEKEYKGKK